MDDYYNATRKLRRAEAEQRFHVDVFGDHLAQKQGYKQHSGIDAVWFYLVERYHWTPATVRALNTEDLVFLLAEEMSGWTVPQSAKPES
ncbi:hypothetical protein [Bradyrhizobium sp. SZCCHNR3118]|uniref:hypothetical protein n=1 Tax=Bradyrhizobium sp. SZCCHNR3118 TaxID=3057468 RepID=UPI002915F38D|nr:hypothetical protein [Bradyrhizobium sp. SZCCHNR3118]